ncbi:betaine aldehyde dehydrogenase [Tothia fuscella]|uniref:aldehyde dehydrogenase (NAD(+)) n=1 Tax=Tothia fuscella TaxID=1048955 RepID=A0A9P4NW34_9PEZI|nr:betaine aldehyde dehydrogenase [Tothia fuscella]
MSKSYPDQHIYYDGRIQTAHGPTFPSINPATGLVQATIHSSSPSDIEAAITSAKTAFPSWSSTPPVERARILQKAAQLLRSRNDEIAVIETHDTGKPYSETSTVDIVTGTDVLEYYANMIASGGLNGETVKLREDAWVYTTKEPLGVCAGIGAWNYPIQIALWKSSPCLAAGNTMVYKPSEFTPLHGQILASIYSEAGLPPGVFNVIQGAGDVGAALTSHPTIAKVSFTGQVSTGMKVAASAAGIMKYVTVELGGKSPLLILEDADVEQAVDGAMMANFFSTGQVCTNGTRVFVPQAMKPLFEKTLLSKMRYIRSGDLMDPITNFGPLVSKPHYEKVISYLNHGINIDKAHLLYGGPSKPTHLTDNPTHRGGYWIQPTIFTSCTPSMRIVKEEIFGPVMTILYYTSLEEAILSANDTTLGLAAGVFTEDLNMAHKVIARLEAGITWINTWGESPAEMSVGGWKMSGLGVENGKRGLEAWVRGKSTLVDMGGKVGSVFVGVEGEEEEGGLKGVKSHL